MHLLYIVSSTMIIHASVYCSSDGVKARRGGSMGLIAFPRVGRADSRTWLLDMDDLVDPEQEKRFRPFPRVGRAFQPYTSKETLWDELQSAYAYQDGNNPPSNMYPVKLDSMYLRQQEDDERSKEEKRRRPTDGYWFGPRHERSATEYADDVGQEFNSAKTETQSNNRNQPENGLERRKRSTTTETKN